MAHHYRQQVAQLTDIVNDDEDRAEAADIIRSLVDQIELTRNNEGTLDIDLYGDLAGILDLPANKTAPPGKSDASIQQVKMVAGARKLIPNIFQGHQKSAW